VREWWNEDFMTVAEVAELLKLNQQTIRNWIDDGKLPAVRIGRKVRVLRSDLEQLILSSYTGDSPRQETPVDSHDGFWEGSAPAAEPAPQGGSE